MPEAFMRAASEVMPLSGGDMINMNGMPVRVPTTGLYQLETRIRYIGPAHHMVPRPVLEGPVEEVPADALETPEGDNIIPFPTNRNGERNGNDPQPS